MPEDTMLQEAITALRQGQRGRARDLLTRLLRANQSDPQYWLWMSAAVDSQKEQMYCLQSVLRLDPGNRDARRGLVLLGAMTPPVDSTTTPPVRRKWTVSTQEEPKPRGFRAIWDNPVMRVVTLLGAFVLVVGLILIGILGPRLTRAKPAALARPTITAGPPPTFTPTPTPVNVTILPPTFTPEITGPPPLAALLEATYTPTPRYVNTPHAANEAYRVGLREIERGNWEFAVSNLEQAMRMEPKMPDIPYWIGEALRAQGEYQPALGAYDQALKLNPNFAPAYLGRARTSLAINPQVDISKDLQKAIDKDRNFGEAYLERAQYYLKKGDAKAALKDLQNVEKTLPDAPLLYLYRAQAALQVGDSHVALESARRTVQLDPTLLPGYLVLGQASLLNGDTVTTIQSLETYLTYQPDNAAAWAGLGQAYYREKRFEKALESLNKAIDLDQQQPDAFLYRGLIELDRDQLEESHRDLARAYILNTRSFDAALALGRVQLASGSLREARDQFIIAQERAKTDEQLAMVYFWRAQAVESIGNPQAAAQDWQALLDLPGESVPADWLTMAREHLQAGSRPGTVTKVVTSTPLSTTGLPSTITSTALSKPTLTPQPIGTEKPVTTGRAATTQPATSTQATRTLPASTNLPTP